MMERDKNIVDLLCELGLEYLFLGSVVSADTLISLNACIETRRELDNFNHDLKLANITEEKRTELQGFVDKAYEIIKQQIKRNIKVKGCSRLYD